MWHMPFKIQLPSASRVTCSERYLLQSITAFRHIKPKKKENPPLNFLKFYMPVRNDSYFRSHNELIWHEHSVYSFLIM